MNKIGIFGATGLIGRTFLKILKEEHIKADLKLFASYKSQGKRIHFNNKYYEVTAINEDSFKDITHAFFFLPNDVVKSIYPYVKKYNVKVIDNSSSFRLDDNTPLVIDEINGKDLNKDQDTYIANPNCSTIQSVLPLYYLDKEFDLESVNYVTYQSLSGGGNKLLNSYKDNELLKVVYPFIGEVNNDYSKEETKMIEETKKLLKKKLEIRAFCARVPVLYTHAVYIDAIFKKDIDFALCKNVLKQKRIKLSSKSAYLKDKNYILVTRLRKDKYNDKRLQFICYADNLRVGAAYNAFLIGKRLKFF